MIQVLPSFHNDLGFHEIGVRKREDTLSDTMRDVSVA
jgi:hypothetical protein